jgi:hypothetical protein
MGLDGYRISINRGAVAADAVICGLQSNARITATAAPASAGDRCALPDAKAAFSTVPLSPILIYYLNPENTGRGGTRRNT